MPPVKKPSRRKKPGPKPVLVVKPAVLRRFRLEAGMEVADLARESEISASRIRDFESGQKGGISIKSAKALAAALGHRFTEFTEVVEEVAS